jgi:hypothetical protein
MRFGTEEADPVLWIRLVTLGVKLGETYMVVASVVDPDFVIGGTAVPVHFFPAKGRPPTFTSTERAVMRGQADPARMWLPATSSTRI